jgi:hypothetical protein
MRIIKCTHREFLFLCVSGRLQGSNHLSADGSGHPVHFVRDRTMLFDELFYGITCGKGEDGGE